MMKRIVLALMCVLSLGAMAQTETVFTKEQFPLNSGAVLPYRQMRIAGENPMLVIYLHGGSSCGTDNETQMGEPGIDSIAQYLVEQALPALFVVPQCSNRTKGWGGMASDVKRLLDYVAQQETADTTRIYIFGGSMGGTGTWKMLSLYPAYFAAAMPCAGNPKGMNAENIATTPVYTVMGLADKIMGSDVRTTVETLVGQLEVMGDDVRYETVAGWTHEMTCIQSYSAERLDWVFSHKRGQTTDLIISPIDSTDETWYDLSGRRFTMPPSRGVYIHRGKKVVF